MRIDGEYKSVTIYVLKFNDQPKYVGQTTGSVKQRVYKHFNNAISSNKRVNSSCPKLYEHLRLHPNKQNYSVQILEQTNRENGSERERFWIEKFNTKNNGLNATIGGKFVGGTNHYLYGKNVSREIVAASVKARLGKPLSDEHKEKIRQGNRVKKTCKPVLRSDGVEFFSAAESARQMKVSVSAIIQAIRKKSQSAGYKWSYKTQR